VFAAERDGDQLDEQLHGVGVPPGRLDVVGQQQQTAGAQHPVHLAQRLSPKKWQSKKPISRS